MGLKGVVEVREEQVGIWAEDGTQALMGTAAAFSTLSALLKFPLSLQLEPMGFLLPAPSDGKCCCDRPGTY